jgi:hypothetical protein
LYDYFYSTFINPQTLRFGPEIWSVINPFDISIPKTNNAIEGWHNTFKNTFGTSRYSFQLLIFKLKDEEEAVRQKKIRMDLNERHIRKKKYVEIEENLNNYIMGSSERFGYEYISNLVDILFY